MRERLTRGSRRSALDEITQILFDGNRSELARALNVHRSTISGWANPSRRARGMCGTVPEKYLPVVLDIANTRGVSARVCELILGAAKA
jgi:predicted transcriptional regulator